MGWAKRMALSKKQEFSSEGTRSLVMWLTFLSSLEHKLLTLMLFVLDE